MSKFKEEEIAGYSLPDGDVCAGCVSDDDLKQVELDDLITVDKIQKGDELVFCDRCKKLIQS